MENTRKQDDEIRFPTLRTVDATAPLEWLALALADLRHAPWASLFYGSVFAVMGFALDLTFTNAPHVALALITGFTLIGPFLAIGFYDISRRLERGETVRLRPTLSAAWPAKGSLGLFSIILALLMAGWVRVSVVLVGLFFIGTMPTMETLVHQMVFSTENLPFLLVYFSVGFAFAALVFAISVVSIPLMMDRNTDTLTAMFASFASVTKNPKAMLLWAALIVGLCLLGMVSYYVGMVVVMPLIGHATWHAYRALVEKET